jgi:hypothetical protein
VTFRASLLAWGALLAAGGLWELWSLLQQSALTATSYAHPTLSALTDPVLTGSPGRTLVLARVGVLAARAWIGLHFFARLGPS